MATRETRLQRGRRTGLYLVRRTLSEMRVARSVSGLSQRALASQLGISQPEICRLEGASVGDVSVLRLC